MLETRAWFRVGEDSHHPHLFRRPHRMHTAEKNHLHNGHPALHDQLQHHIDWLDAILKDLHTDIQPLLELEPALKTRSEPIQSAPAVGMITGATLMADLLELRTLDRKRIASLVGAAPINQDSGRKSCRRCIRGGAPRLRPPSA